MADQPNGRDTDIAEVHATLRALEPALTKTASLLPVLVDDVGTMKRLLPTMVEAIKALHTDMAEMRSDMQEIKLLLRNGHG